LAMCMVPMKTGRPRLVIDCAADEGLETLPCETY
jgi:hypothetical protein